MDKEGGEGGGGKGGSERGRRRWRWRRKAEKKGNLMKAWKQFPYCIIIGTDETQLPINRFWKIEIISTKNSVNKIEENIE